MAAASPTPSPSGAVASPKAGSSSPRLGGGDDKEKDETSDLTEDSAEAQLVAQEMVQSLTITGTRKVQKTKTEKMHVDYIVHVTTQIAGVSWNINRRYNSFVDLHAALKKLVKAEKDLPPLPPKHSYSLTRTSTPEQIDKRKNELNAYLNALLKNPLIAKSEVWCSFLVGTFHDIFSRLKNFAVKNAKLTSDLAMSEQQRLAAVAQLQAERRKTDELRAANAELDTQLKAAKSDAVKQAEAYSKLESELAASRAEAKKAAAERDANRNELNALATSMAAYKQTTDDQMRVLSDAAVANTKELARLKAEIAQLQSQKKLLVKGIKDLREGKVSTAHSDATNATVHANMALFVAGLPETGADGVHVAPAITPGTAGSLSIAAPVSTAPPSTPAAVYPVTAAAAAAKKP